MVDMPRTDFWNTERIDMIWEWVRWFLTAHMPIIMIVFAFFLMVGMVSIIISLFERKPDDDDDEVEYL